MSYNKFLAKLASDQNKPDGLCVIRPGEGSAFVAGLPIRRFHGVGPKAEERMQRLGIATGADLAGRDIAFLREHFRQHGRLPLPRGARDLTCAPCAPTASANRLAGRTFAEDIGSGAMLRETLENIIDIVWERIEAAGSEGQPVRGRTVTLKLKFNDFRTHDPRNFAAALGCGQGPVRRSGARCWRRNCRCLIRSG